jgi:S-formylglutathione hydrolase FrmB
MFISTAALLALLCGLTQGLPQWLAANTRVSASENAVVGASMSGSAPLIPDDGTHTWSYWGAQPHAMKPDLYRVPGAG